MSGYVVTEGQFDANLVKRVLKAKPETQSVQVIAGRGRSSIISLAQSLLVSRMATVAIIADADTSDLTQVSQLTRIWADLLGGSTFGSRYQIFLAVPELESVFFERPNFLKQYLDIDLSTEDRERARLEPKKVIESVLPYASGNGGWRSLFYRSLSPAAYRDLLKASFFERVTAFLSEP